MKKSARVVDWMTPDPITVGADTSLVEAHELMTKHNIRRLPVMDGRKLVGIVTLGDVRGAEPSEATSLSIWELNYLLARLTVEHIMSAPVVTVEPETPVAKAAQTMLNQRIAGLPVMENGEVVGIITESDIFRMVVQEWQQEPDRAPA